MEQQLTIATQQHEEAKTKQAAAKRAEAAHDETERVKTTWETAKQVAEKVNRAVSGPNTPSHRSAAGFLADKLQDGQPCEVCGSTSHPAPATTHGLEDISNEAVQQAEHQAIEARRAANDAEEKYQTQHATLQALQAEAGGLSLGDATDLVTENKQAVTTAKAQVK